MEFLFVLFFLFGVFGFCIFCRQQNEKERLRLKKERFDSLMLKYNNDSNIVQMIIDKKVWEGQTSEQLVDSIGVPENKEQKVLKTKIKEVWKYQSDGENRDKLRVMIDNNLVVGWERID